MSFVFKHLVFDNYFAINHQLFDYLAFNHDVFKHSIPSQ